MMLTYFLSGILSFNGTKHTEAYIFEGKTGCFPDPCVAVGPGVFPAVATLHRKPEGKHKANRHSVKPFVEPSGDARVPPGTKLYRPADERRACAGGVLAKVVAKFLTPEIVLDPISGLLKIGDSPSK